MEKVIEINRGKNVIKYNVKDCIILLKKFEFFAPTCCESYVLFTCLVLVWFEFSDLNFLLMWLHIFYIFLKCSLFVAKSK